VTHLIVLAQASGMSSLILGVLFIGIIYAMLILPQQKQLKQHKALLASLKKGDDVVTQGGVIGRIAAISDRVITLEIATGVKMKVLKTSIQGRAADAEEQPVKSADDKKEEK
jgi:preprotein translocase subunit YajC